MPICFRYLETLHTSLLYLAPELLLTTHLQSFLGGRQVGMVVIDEAHTVTSWGRDFRSDYWFLGDFLKQTARDGLSFPVLCLTATAVYSGDDDVVNDRIFCQQCRIRATSQLLYSPNWAVRG